MAARDEQVPTNWLSPVDALRRVQELGEQLASAARSYSQGERGDEDEAPDGGARAVGRRRGPSGRRSCPRCGCRRCG